MEMCPVEYAMSIIGGKWKLLILWKISQKNTIRFNELQREVKDISSLMLSKNLKELEADGIVNRVQYNEIPPRVEYSLTELGQKLLIIISGIADWGQEAYKYKQSPENHKK